MEPSDPTTSASAPCEPIVAPTRGASILIVRLGTVCGRQCVLAVGLSSRLQAWTQNDSGKWISALNVRNCQRLAKGRWTSHPYRCLTQIENCVFAAASNQPDAPIAAYCTRTWTAVQELRPDAVDRFTPSCLEMRGSYLACGSREGTIALWRFDAEGRRFSACWDGSALARADEGPIAAVAVDELSGLVIVAYRQAKGSVDGAPFEGGQRVAAWRLDSGRAAWSLRMPGDSFNSNVLTPTLGLLCRGDALWVLHANGAAADGEWPMLPTSAEANAPRPASSHIVLRGSCGRWVGAASDAAPAWCYAASVDDGSVLSFDVTSDGGGGNGGGGNGGDGIDVADGTELHGRPRAVLAWSASADGSSLAIGFAGGGVALLDALSSRLYAGHPDKGSAAADVGSVAIVAPASMRHAVRGSSLWGSSTSFSSSQPGVIAATAARRVQLWTVDGGESLQLVLSASLPFQTSALSISESGFACGGADGRVGFWPWEALCDGAALAWSMPIDDAAVAVVDATTASSTAVTEVKDDSDETICVNCEYDWMFSMDGHGGGARVCERREAFNGWARTADYDRGLLDLLLGRSAPSIIGVDGGAGGGREAATERAITVTTTPPPHPTIGARLATLLWARITSSRLLHRRLPPWPRYSAGALPPPEVAVCSRVVRVRQLLSADEVAAVRSLAVELPASRKHPTAARATSYLSSGGAFASRLPHLHRRMLDTARTVDMQQRWKLLEGRKVAPRCVECHTLGAGKDVLHPGHYDFGSVVTIDIMLSGGGEFAGGAFLTAEADGSVHAHAFGCGDALVFVSHKPHFVADVTEGERRVLIMELWEGEERTCPHRCEVRRGACLASVATRSAV